jgi:hypothetical protein
VLLCLTLLTSPLLTAESKLTKEDLVSRHLESIGSEEALSGVSFRYAQGACIAHGRMISQASVIHGPLQGRSRFATGPDSIQFSLEFDNEHYPVEGFGFDGAKLSLMAFDPPHYSGFRDNETRMGCLTTCVLRWEEYVKEHLFGGVLNTLWPLLKPEEVSDKLRSLKRKKLDGRELLALRYHVKGTRGAELFFEPETFRHLATQFLPWRTRSKRAEYVTLWEKFGDFEDFDGIRLPTRWTITLELPQETPRWEVKFYNIKHPDGPELIRPNR